MYLHKDNLANAAALINSPLWNDIKRCLMDRRPDAAVAHDEVHTAAAKGFERKGFELAIVEIEKLPFDTPTVRVDPFDRPAITSTQD
jgi:hypothetical protein